MMQELGNSETLVGEKRD